MLTKGQSRTFEQAVYNIDKLLAHEERGIIDNSYIPPERYENMDLKLGESAVRDTIQEREKEQLEKHKKDIFKLPFHQLAAWVIAKKILSVQKDNHDLPHLYKKVYSFVRTNDNLQNSIIAIKEDPLIKKLNCNNNWWIKLENYITSLKNKHLRLWQDSLNASSLQSNRFLCNYYLNTIVELNISYPNEPLHILEKYLDQLSMLPTTEDKKNTLYFPNANFGAPYSLASLLYKGKTHWIVTYLIGEIFENTDSLELSKEILAKLHYLNNSKDTATILTTIKQTLLCFRSRIFKYEENIIKWLNDIEKFSTNFDILQKKIKKVDIAFLGDSYSKGVGLEDSNDGLVYKSITFAKNAGFHNIDFVNISSSNMTTVKCLQENIVDAVLKIYNPNFIVLAYGGNDPLQEIDVFTTMKNIKSMIEKCLANNCKVVIGIGLPHSREFDQNINVLYRRSWFNMLYEIEKTYPNIIVIRPNYQQLTARYMQADGIHPIKEAHTALADNFFKVMQDEFSKIHEVNCKKNKVIFQFKSTPVPESPNKENNLSNKA